MIISFRFTNVMIFYKYEHLYKNNTVILPSHFRDHLQTILGRNCDLNELRASWHDFWLFVHKIHINFQRSGAKISNGGGSPLKTLRRRRNYQRALSQD